MLLLFLSWFLTCNGTKWPKLCLCAVKKLLTHSLQNILSESREWDSPDWRRLPINQLLTSRTRLGSKLGSKRAVWYVNWYRYALERRPPGTGRLHCAVAWYVSVRVNHVVADQSRSVGVVTWLLSANKGPYILLYIVGRVLLKKLKFENNVLQPPITLC